MLNANCIFNYDPLYRFKDKIQVNFFWNWTKRVVTSATQEPTIVEIAVFAILQCKCERYSKGKFYIGL